MKISEDLLKEMILGELKRATGAVAAQDNTFGQESLYKIDKYGQYFDKIAAVFDQLVEAIISDIKSEALPRNLSVMLLTDHFERLEDMISTKKKEIMAVEKSVRGEVRADVED